MVKEREQDRREGEGVISRGDVPRTPGLGREAEPGSIALDRFFFL